MEKDYMEQYNEFWKEIVEDENGNLIKDQIARELHDYSLVIENVPKVYCEITDNQLSYPTYDACTVIRVYQDCLTKNYVDKEELCDILLNFCDNLSVEEIKQKLIEIFRLEETYAYEDYFEDLEEKEE